MICLLVVHTWTLCSLPLVTVAGLSMTEGVNGCNSDRKSRAQSVLSLNTHAVLRMLGAPEKVSRRMRNFKNSRLSKILSFLIKIERICCKARLHLVASPCVLYSRHTGLDYETFRSFDVPPR